MSFTFPRAQGIFAAGLLLSGHCLSARDESKDFVVFVGLKPTVQHGTEMYPIVGARTESVDVVADGRYISLSTNNLAAVETATVPKVSALQIELDGASTELGYAGAGPEADRDRQQLLLSILAAERQTKAINNWKEAYSAHRLASPENAGEAEAALGEAESAFDQTTVENMRWAEADLGAHPKSAGFNALIYSARISAPQEIDGAYGMLRLSVSDPANPHARFSTIRFISLPKIGMKPQDVRASIGLSELPEGFRVEECTLHVFVGEHEFATSSSRNRARLTLNEAHEFLRFRHQTENKSSTLPPQIVAELVPPELAANVPSDQRWITVDFEIDSQGAVVDMNSTPTAPALSPHLAELLHSVRFYPALAMGTPVDSRGTFALSEFIH